MNRKKQRKQELKEARVTRQRKRSAAILATRGIHYRPEHRIAVCPEALSEKSQLSWGVPKFYKDECYKCVDCGKEILFSAEQQKEWYEVKKRYIYQRPVRCRDHFLQWLSDRKIKLKMDKSLEKIRLMPDSEEAMRDYAFSIVEFHKRNGMGDLNTAIHLLRQLKEEGEALEYCLGQVQKTIQAKKEMLEFMELFRSETICAFQEATGKPDELKAVLIQCLYRGYQSSIDVLDLFNILYECDEDIISQAGLSDEDEILVRDYLESLIKAIFCDLDYMSLFDAIESHKKIICKLYNDWNNNY